VALGTAGKIAAWSEAARSTQTATAGAAEAQPAAKSRPRFRNARPARTRIKPATQRLPR
jgi:hypothetical protein